MLPPSSPCQPLPQHVLTWAVNANGVPLTYGDMHEMIHRDISVGNDYRKERIKLLITLATGVFALTVTFNKDLFRDHISGIGLILVLVGWTFLLVSLLGGIYHFRAWEDFYLQFRAVGKSIWRYRTALTDEERIKAEKSYHTEAAIADEYRSRYKLWNWLQTWCLLAGLFCIGAYVGVAVHDRIVRPDPRTQAPPPTKHRHSERRHADA